MFLGRLNEFVLRHKLATVLIVGISVRLFLMPISAHPFDMYVWYSISENILKNGLFVLQGFPPLWAHYMLVPVAYAYSGLSQLVPTGAISMSSLPSALNFYSSYSIEVVPGLLFNFIAKVPFLISDVLVAFLLYKIVGEVTRNEGLAVAASVLWFLNPFVIWISAGWGMWDTLPALFSLLSLYFLVKGRFAYSAVSLSLGVALKLYPVVFLVPFVFYLYRASSAGDRTKNFVRFFGVFAVSSLIVFLPYLGAIGVFFEDFFLLQSGSGIGRITPLGPLGYGLTYWSIYSLNQLFNVPVNASFVFYASAASLLLVVVALMLVYWRTSRFSFKMPVLDLSTAMVFSVAALLLSYRIVSEQWIVWLLPFLVIVCISGNIRRRVLWAISLFALLYAVLNCPLPFFFLPLSPWISNVLLDMVYFVWWVDALRIVLLAVLGCVFSAALLLLVLRLNKKVHVG